MNCKRAQKYLAAYVDGELKGWWRRRGIMKHLERCVLCQKMVRIQKQVKHLLRTNVQSVEAPKELRTKIQKMLEKEFSHFD